MEEKHIRFSRREKLLVALVMLIAVYAATLHIPSAKQIPTSINTQMTEASIFVETSFTNHLETDASLTSTAEKEVTSTQQKDRTKLNPPVIIEQTSTYATQTTIPQNIAQTTKALQTTQSQPSTITQETQTTTYPQNPLTKEVDTITTNPLGLIDINTAHHQLLCTLKGIGDVKAKAIIDYRNEVGAFTCIEDIMNVSGIGTITYENIKDYITV